MNKDKSHKTPQSRLSEASTDEPVIGSRFPQRWTNKIQIVYSVNSLSKAQSFWWACIMSNALDIRMFAEKQSTAPSEMFCFAV